MTARYSKSDLMLLCYKFSFAFPAKIGYNNGDMRYLRFIPKNLVFINANGIAFRSIRNKTCRRHFILF